jgi:hypothetical protein
MASATCTSITHDRISLAKACASTRTLGREANIKAAAMACANCQRPHPLDGICDAKEERAALMRGRRSINTGPSVEVSGDATDAKRPPNQLSEAYCRPRLQWSYLICFDGR